MKKLAEYKNEIHSCSKCGLCQSDCPVYQVTGNDCTVSRGLFIMLYGILKGKLVPTKKINEYLDLCLKCGACEKFCPSGIEVVDIITSAKAEYFQSNTLEKFISFIQKCIILGGVIKLITFFRKKTKSKEFEKKVVYFGGCGGNIKGNSSVIKLLNTCKIEVISPEFDCCGIPFFARGDFETFEKYTNKYLKILEKYKDYDVVTTCASCEKTLKKNGINAKNLFEYLKLNDIKLKLKKMKTVTFHKPCNLANYSDIKWVLENTENLNFVEMKDFDKCCGLNGILKFRKLDIMSKIFKQKRENIVNSMSKIVLTSCLGCEVALSWYSRGKYKVFDFAEFLAKNAFTCK